MEPSYPWNLFMVEKLFKIYLTLIFLRIFLFLHFLNITLTLPNPWHLSKKLHFIDGFQCLHISNSLNVFLTSLTRFGVTKMRSSRRERSFSSSYFIPKCNYIEDSAFRIAQKSKRESCCFSFWVSLSSFFFLIFSSFSLWRLPVFASQKLGRRVHWSKRICHINPSRLKKNGHIWSFKICVDNESEWITKDGLNVLKVNE